MTLRGRMAAVAGLAVALAVVGLAVSVYLAVRSELLGQINQSLTERAQPFLGPGGPGGPGGRGGPGGPPPGGGPPGPPPGFRAPPGNGGPPPGGQFGGASGQVQLLSPAGVPTQAPGQLVSSAIPVDTRARAIAASGRGRSVTDMQAGGVHIRVLTVGHGAAGAVQVARPLTEVDRDLRRVLLILVVAGAAGIALAVALGLLVARTALAPIARFTRRTESLTATPRLSERLDVHGRDELARLARSFNATLDALERSVEAQRHLVADASHELRTPIASLRANVQVLEDADRLAPDERASLRADIISELDDLTRLVGDVVELARGTRVGASVDDVRLDEIVRAEVDRTRRRAGGLRLHVEVQPTLVSGEGDRIARAVANLLDNARKWSPAGEVIEVRLSAGTLRVRDHGPGFAPEDLPHVFDRFYRADGARALPGSGLGLSIVRQAAEAHGGFARAANAPGGGAVIEVGFGPTLPIAEDSDAVLQGS